MTDIGIANIALVLIGEDTIISMDSGEGEKQRKLNAIYNSTRDEVLRSYPWGFATTQGTLGLLTEVPTYTYSYAYQLPSDCIKIQSTEGDTEYKIHGRTLYSDEATLNVTYTKRVTDSEQFDPSFTNAFAAKLAFKLAYALPNSTSLQSICKQYYDEAIREARGVDSQEDTGDPLFSDELSEARLGTFSIQTGYVGEVE